MREGSRANALLMELLLVIFFFMISRFSHLNYYNETLLSFDPHGRWLCADRIGPEQTKR